MVYDVYDEGEEIKAHGEEDSAGDGAQGIEIICIDRYEIIRIPRKDDDQTCL